MLKKTALFLRDGFPYDEDDAMMRMMRIGRMPKVMMSKAQDDKKDERT